MLGVRDRFCRGAMSRQVNCPLTLSSMFGPSDNEDKKRFWRCCPAAAAAANTCCGVRSGGEDTTGIETHSGDMRPLSCSVPLDDEVKTANWLRRGCCAAAAAAANTTVVVIVFPFFGV